MWPITWFTVVAFFLSAVVADSAAVEDPPLLPSQDPWYDQPENIASFSPGQLIRAREVPSKLQPFFSSLPADISVQSVHQYLFRTTDSIGDPVAAVVTLIEPSNADPNKLLAYQAPYDSASPDCSPSYTIQDRNTLGFEGFKLPGTNISTDIPFVAAALNKRWWVLTTDYEGLDAHFTAGLQSGHATLDSIRVVLKEGPKVGLGVNPNYALWGYSGGALASGWAVELQPTYAPELTFAGAAIGGLTPNVSSVLETINNSSFTGLAFSGMYGQAKAYSNFSDWLETNLVPEKANKFWDAANSCLAGARDKGGGEDMYKYVRNGKASFLEPVPQSIFKWSGQMGIRGTPTVPLFVYKAVGDEVSPIEDTDALVKQYCANGARIEYHRDWVGKHMSEAIAGSASALNWLNERMNGEEVDEKCSTKQVVLSELDPATIVTLGEELFAFLQSILGGIL
ncbi:LIP-domain-containing protein [Aspergillus taichungensis]|uniref:LIP-domain-containing protein n=1 Tax=Aspergillus taichungensis TaxID=482145 RepID=A0A2J5I739_9EURO|nr:LIP-domain-containing protein [Aspergillus taichungensis]